jgi:cell division protein FtsN
MNVIAITLFVSLILGIIFIVCFAVEATKKGKSSLEHDSLLPLEDDE